MISVCHPVALTSTWKFVHTADTAVRLTKYFNISESFWMGSQSDYNAEGARRSLERKLIRIPSYGAYAGDKIQETVGRETAARSSWEQFIESK